MDKGLLQQLGRAIRRRFLPRRHSVLLVAIVAAIAVRPLIGDVGIGPVVFSIALLLLLLDALYAIQVDELIGERERLRVERRRRSIIGWVLAVPAIVERLAVIFVPSRSLYLAG